MKLNAKPSEVNVDNFTQEIPNVPRDKWQVAYDEHYLDESGLKVIGDFFVKPLEDKNPTRLTFFLYYVNFDSTLQTPFGEVQLPAQSTLPQRLKDVIEFEEAD